MRSRFLAYGTSLAALAAALLARWLLDPLLGSTVPFVTLFGAVAAAVWVGGYRPASLVAVAGYAACNYFFIEPRNAYSDIFETQTLITLIAYLITCGIIIGFGEWTRVSTRRFEDLRHRAERETPTIATVDAIRSKYSVRDLAVLGFLLTLAVLVLGGFLGVGNVRRLAANERLITHSHEVMGQLDSVLTALIDAETGQRGYLLAGDERYLAPYDAAVSRMHATLAELERLLADDAAQQARLAALEPKIRQRMDGLAQTIAVEKAGNHAAAVDLMLGGRGKLLMDAVRSDIAAMRQAEQTLLQRRAAESRVMYQATLLSILLPALIAVGLLGIVFSVTRRNLLIRQRAVDAVAEQWESLRVTLASIGDAVITTDSRGHVTYLNAVAESLTGWSQEAAGRPLEDVFRIVNEQSRAVVASPVAKVLQEGVIVGLANHTLLIRKDGSEVPIDDSAAPIRVEAGPLLGCVLVFRDVSARRRIERDIWASRELLRTTLSSIGDGVISTDPAGRIVFLNPIAERLTGWTQDEAAGQSLDAVFRVVDEQTRLTVENPATRSLREGIVVGLSKHTVLVRKDGSELPIDDSAAPIRSADGEVVGCVLVFRDVTSRRRDELEREELLAIAERARGEAEAALNELARIQAIADTALVELPYEQLLDALVRRVREAVGSDTCTLLLVDDIDGSLHVRASVGVGEAAAARVRVPLGQGFAGNIAKERRPRIWNAVRYDQVVSDYIRDKGIRALAGVPLLSADDGVLGVLHVGRTTARMFVDEDVRLLQLAAERVALAVEHAARREAERRSRELAEASNRAKDEFLAMLGHELRNPLSAIRNAVATASLDEARRARSLDIARRQAEQLGRLIDDLLDVARITQGKITLRKERVYLAEILERAVESTQSFIESRGLRLSISLAAEPVRVEADPARLEQVFVNLLSNAGKYTDAGGRIELGSRLEAGEVSVRVRDTGIGIAPDVLPRMWELFSQAERTLDRSQGGLGIGLTVARRLVEMHGGRIEAHSEGLGRGSEFTVTLPALAVTPEEIRAEHLTEPVPQRTARVLLVEDNPDAADSLALLLEVLGHRVRSVYDGVTALDAARANPPDVMLVDIGLPGMDGYEVARRIRRDPALKNTVLVALTGYGRDEDKRQAMAAGFDYHLVKPVNPDALQGLVARLAGADPGGPPAIH